MTDVKMVSLTIEGRQATVPEGTSILEAAKTVGVLIPHYCYHPGLRVAGSCRMCQVEVEKFPKLAPSCATAAAEGQVVHVHSEKALEARKGVLEFLLINHPLDCPICDKSGECELQDYTFAEGPAQSRLREPKRFHPMEDFGGDVLYVQNRCILCTRCVRFVEDKMQEPILNVSERGDRAFIGIAEGHELTNPWAGNVIDLCPVGSLLSKDFLNKARAWELDRAATICTGCSQGCNIVAETRDNVVVRMKPRPNAEVNEYFMCEIGRQTYREFNRRDRADQPLVRGSSGLEVSDWESAIESAAATLSGKQLVILASPNTSNESLFLLERLLSDRSGTKAFRVLYGDEVPLPGAHDLALRPERAANGAGARLLGFKEIETLGSVLKAGDALLVVGDQLDGIDPAVLGSANGIVYVGTTVPAVIQELAKVVLPITNTLEEEGTFTNLRGRVQRYLQARTAPGLARPTWSVLSDLLALASENSEGGAGSFFAPREVFAALVNTHAAFDGLSYETLGLQGLPIASAAELAVQLGAAV